jgi:hypothetical protein
MKKRFLLIVFLIFNVNVSYSQHEPTLDQPIDNLIGNWEVIVEAQNQAGEWIKGETSTSTFSSLLDGTFIQEKVTYVAPDMTINMHIIFGLDGRTKEYRVFALDKEFGTMDVYTGQMKQNMLVVDNLGDEGFLLPDGKKLNYRLTYVFKNKNSLELNVDYTADECSTWKPFQRIKYTRHA